MIETKTVLGLREALAHHASADRTAFFADGGAMSYAAFSALVALYAAGSRDIAKGAFVGILAPRGIEAIAAFLGLMVAGACPCFMEPRVSPDATADRMDSVGMTLLLIDGAIGDTGAPAAEGLVRPLASIRATHPNVAPAQMLSPDDRAMMLFTSGSTGRPKGVVLSHGNLACNAQGVIARTKLSPDDRLLHVMPLHHTNGINNQVIAALLSGASIILEDKFVAERIPDLIDAHAATIMTGVPTIYARLLPHVVGRSFPSLRFLRCGSAPITRELHVEIESAFGVPLIVSYGLSEATCTSLMNPPEARRIGTVGTPLAGQTVRLLAADSTREVEDGHDGEICIRGPSLMLGYVGAPDPFDAGWLRTGDLGRFDADGYLEITGRIKDVIIRGGENISPQLVENALAGHPDVVACCVVGAPHPEWGEVAIAFVVPRAGVDTDLSQSLSSRIMAILPKAYVPHAFRTVTALPENGVGKIDRKALRAVIAAEGIHA
jgi:acyl-CoA synthetase (AMP-forming)/AMP-acid ligase II